MDRKKHAEQNNRSEETEQIPFAPEGPLLPPRPDRGVAPRLRPLPVFRRLMASRWRDLWLLVMIVLIGAGVLVALSNLEGLQPSPSSRETVPPTSKTLPTLGTPLPPAKVSVQVVSPRLYPLPPPMWA